MESPEHQRRNIEEYFFSQSPEGTEVRHLEKVHSERVFGRKHAVWDVHSSEGRWWVITNPTNLYPHDDREVTPSLDRALAIHIGLTARVEPVRAAQAGCGAPVELEHLLVGADDDQERRRGHFAEAVADEVGAAAP